MYANMSGCILIQVPLGTAGSTGTWFGGPTLSHRVSQVERDIWMQSWTQLLMALLSIIPQVAMCWQA